MMVNLCLEFIVVENHKGIVSQETLRGMEPRELVNYDVKVGHTPLTFHYENATDALSYMRNGKLVGGYLGDNAYDVLDGIRKGR